MHHPSGQTRQTAQCGRLIQITQQGQYARSEQNGLAFRRRGQRNNPKPGRQLAGNSQAHIAAADDQDALAAKASGQRTEGIEV